MRLLNTSTFRLRQLTEGESAPPYAALSHCWGAEEVLYSDLQTTDIDLSQKNGFQKLMGACREACNRHQLDWLWADTVCIDRSSSAELSESINSMYRWYRNCSICLAYLGDVCAPSGPPEDVLADSRWMQRSWTLIELIAPRNMQFFSVDWTLIGTKESLISTLSRITQIDETVLEDADNMSDASIGKRMSWAARRTATHVEDVAYSLMGIFGISMPTIYGEGERAFMRLQEELLKTLDDASLFAWKATDDQLYRGLLARSPSEFNHFGLLEGSTTSWRLPSALRLAFTTPTLTCNLGLDGLHQETSLPLSDISDKPNSAGSLGIRLRVWQGRLVRSSPQRLFYVSSKVSFGAQEIPVAREVDARSSRLISQAMIAEQRRHTTQFFHSQSKTPLPSGHLISSSQHAENHPPRIGCSDTDSEITGPVWSTAAESSSGADFPPESSSSFTMAAEECSNSTPRCDIASVSSALQDDDLEEDDLSNGSGDYESYLFLSPAQNSQPMELDTPFAALTDAVAEMALDRFTIWLTDCSVSYKSGQTVDVTPSGKRLKVECSLEHKSHKSVVSREPVEENDLVIVDTLGTSSFSCPFYVQDKSRHLDCLTRTDLRTIRDLKQHLWTAHRQPYYCPTCGTTFARDSMRDQHIRDRTCSPEQWKEAPEGLSECQLQKLAKRCKPGTSEVNQWFDIWTLIYTKEDGPPPHEAPRTPFLTGKLESAVCVARDFWAQKGKFVVAEFLEQRDLRDYQVRDEERNLAALYQITLSNVIDQLVQLLTDEDSGHIGPSQAMSNVLSTLRKLWSKLM